MGSLFIHNINMIKWNRAAKGVSQPRRTHKNIYIKLKKKKKGDTWTHEKNKAELNFIS